MKTGAPRQPRFIAELKGATRHDPARFRDRYAQSPLPVGKAPDYLSKEERAVWSEVVAVAIDGTIRAPQRFSLEVCSVLIAEFRSSPREFPATKYNILRGCLSDLCLTTVAQQKLKVELADTPDAYSAYVD
jgi:hypothetical protein